MVLPLHRFIAVLTMFVVLTTTFSTSLVPQAQAAPSPTMAAVPTSGGSGDNSGGSSGSDIFGTIAAPEGVDKYNDQARVNGGGIGLLVFISNLIKLITIIAGLWVLVNFIMAGLTYIQSAGDSSATKKVYDKMTMSVIGIVIIVGSYTLIALLSLMLFGRPDFILNPTIKGPG